MYPSDLFCKQHKNILKQFNNLLKVGFILFMKRGNKKSFLKTKKIQTNIFKNLKIKKDSNYFNKMFELYTEAQWLLVLLSVLIYPKHEQMGFVVKILRI